MASAILPNCTTFDLNANKLDLDDISISSDRSENKEESDYSLSDIEEGLDDTVIACKDSHVASEIIWSDVDLSIPVKVLASNGLDLRAFVKYDDDTFPSKKCKCHKRIGSDTVSFPNKQTKTGSCFRRRPSRLAVKQETALQGAKEITRQLSNKTTSPNTNPFVSSVSNNSDKSPNIPESDLCASPLRTPSLNSPASENDIKSASEIIVQSLNGEAVNKNDEYSAAGGFSTRHRSLTHSGTPNFPIGNRARSSSLRPTSTRDINDAVKHSNSVSRGSTSVKQLKHYQRAMEAYRRSAEKASGTSKTSCYTNSLPLRGFRRSVFERDSIFDYCGPRLTHTSPESDDKLSESGRSYDQSSSSGASVSNDEDITTIRRWPFVPMSGDVRSKFGDENSLNLDYRLVLRHGSLKRTESSRAKLSLAKSSPNHQSLDPDVVTDIDAIAGFGMPDEVESDKGANLSSSNASTTSEKDQDKIEPEKIVWSGYEKYLRAKQDTKQFPRSSFKMRLAAMERKGIDSRSFEAMENDLSPTSTLKSVNEEESSHVNLRDNQIIKKRNISRSNSSRTDHPKAAQTHLALQILSKSHTIASPSRLSRLLMKESNRLSPVSSPSHSRPNRSSSLKDTSVSQELGETTSKAFSRLSATTIVNNQFPFYNQATTSLNRSASEFQPIRSSRVLSRRKTNKDASVSALDASLAGNRAVQSNKTALYLRGYESTVVTDPSSIYDVPRSCRVIKNKSTAPSQLYEPAYDPTSRTTTTPLRQFHSSTSRSNIGAAKSSALQFARAIADGRLGSKQREFTPGKYPTLDTNCDSDEEDYVSFDSYYSKKQPQKLTKQKLQSRSVSDIGSAGLSYKIDFPTTKLNQSPKSGLSKSIDALNEKENKPSYVKRAKKRPTSNDHSKSTGANFFANRSVSALDIFNSQANHLSSPTPPHRLQRAFLSKEKRRFTSSDLFFGVVKKQSKKLKPLPLEVSVPLTDLMNDPRATYNLTLSDDASDVNRRDETLKRISSFINDESIQKVDKLCQIFEQKVKNHEEKRSTLKLLTSVQRVLKLHKVPTKAGKSASEI